MATTHFSAVDAATYYVNGTQVTSSATELSYLASVSAGTPAASKALVTDAGTSLSTIYFDGVTTESGTLNVSGVFQLAGTAMTSSAAELNFLDGSGAGTATASKALVLGASKNCDVIVIDTTFTLGTKKWTYGSAEPGSPTVCAIGDIVFNNAPTAGGTLGWVCTTAGTPGTWKAWGTIAS